MRDKLHHPNQGHDAVIHEIRALGLHLDRRLDRLKPSGGPTTAEINALRAEVAAAHERLNGGTTTQAMLTVATLKETNMADAAFTALQTEVRDYIAAVDAYVAAVDASIAKAVEADDAGEAIDLQALQAEVAAAKAKLTPVTPSTNP